jgi:hypothetical protein
MEKLDALELAIADAVYWASQLRNDFEQSYKYTAQADALKLLLDEIKEVA